MRHDDPWEPWLADLERASAAGDAARSGAILEELWRFPFHEERARAHRQWDRLFATLVRLLEQDEARLRELALHYARIAMGAEYGPPFGRHTPEQRARSVRRRTAELLPGLARLIRGGAVSLLRCTDDQVHVESLADLPPQAIYLEWIASLAAGSPLGLAARIAYLEGRDNSEPTSALLAYLDHDDTMVRAYAARALGRRHCDADSETELVPSLRELVALLTAKEIERPGIAGPFVSNWYDFGLADFASRAGVDVEEWLCTILATRRHPEPDTLPCSNGIDFFAHEIFGGREGYVRRLLAMGHEALAVEAATEVDERIDDLEPLLVELADRPDAEVCRLACWHLAGLYRHLHATGERRGFVARRALGDDAELFVNLAPRRAGDGADAYSAVAYPCRGDAFDDAAAAACVEAMLPANLRDELVAYGMPGDGGKPGPWVFGRTANSRYRSGALVQLHGDIAAQRWERIRVIWHGPPGAWRPMST